MTEFVGLDLDADLLYHLAVPESVRALIAEHVRPVLIEDEYVRKVFEWQMAHTRDYRKPAAPGVIEDEFDDVVLEEPQTVIEDLIARLRERYIRNNGREVLMGLKDVYKKNPGDLAHALAQKGRELVELTSKRGDAFSVADIDRSLELYDERVLRGRGASFGFDDLDDHFYGQLGLTFLLGSPKTYKSWTGTKAVVKNVIDGRNVWLYALELPAEEADMRVRSLAANVPFWRYLRGALSREDRERLNEASELLGSLGTYTVVKPPYSERDIDTMVMRAADHGADLVIIDQLQYVEVGTSHGPKALGAGDPKDYWTVLNRARDLSDDLPIQFIHQFNRETRFMDEMPTMQHAKGAAAIEETATLVLGLWANKDMRSSNVVELGTLASRNYGTPSWHMGVELSRGCAFEIQGKVEHE